MALFLPQRWRKQPSGLLTLNRQHPVAGSVVFAFLPQHPHRNLVDGDALDTPAAIQTHNGALGATCNDTTGYYAGSTYYPAVGADKPVSVLVSVVRGAVATARPAWIAQSNGGSYGWRFHTQFYGDGNTDNTYEFGGSWSGGTQIGSYSEYPWAIGRKRTLVLSAGLSGADYRANLFADGQRIGSADVICGRDPGTDTAGYFYSDGAGSPSDFRESLILLAVAFAGELPAAVAQDLSTSPWQLFTQHKQVIFSLPATGGTTYNDSVSEGLTLGESQASALTAVATRSEGVTLGDSQAAARITAVTLGESLTLGDSLSAGLIYTDSLSEGVIVGADYAAAAVQAAALSEGLTLDADHATAQTFVEALSAGVTLGDGLAPGLVLAATLAEAVTLGDNFASTVTKDETIAESVTLGDGFAVTLAAVGTVSEGLTFGADLLAAATYPAALSEGVTLGVTLVDEHIQGGVYNDTLDETLALDASFSATLVAGTALAEGIVLDASFYTPPLGQSVRSDGGGGGGRAWGWELDREVEEEMGVLLEGPPLTPATIEAVARRLDAPAESRIIGLKQPPVPAVSFEAAMVRRRRIRRRLLLLL